MELPDVERPNLGRIASNHVDDVFPDANVGSVALGREFCRERCEPRPLGALAEPDPVGVLLLVVSGPGADQRQLGPRDPS